MSHKRKSKVLQTVAHTGCVMRAAWLFRAVCGVAVLIVVSAGDAFGAVSDTVPFSRYKQIIEKEPFGPIPKPPPINTDTNVVTKIDDIEPEPLVPPELENIKVTLMSKYRGIPASGFTDMKTGTSYYLLEGQEFEGFKLLSVDFAGQKIRLGAGGIELDFPMWVNPATTNMADISTFGQLSPMPENAVAATKVTPTPQTRQGPTDEEREARRQRYEEARRQREEERERRRAEMESLTPEEREQRLRNYNMELIRTGGGPPLPIELKPEELQQLANEGFDVPGYNGNDASGGNSGGRRRGPPGGRRGREE